ncbi:MAG: ATP synthase F1 subunit epsilon [bacterium]|nr:ATP synthase F1 subunit epsilon [bacterium]
MAALFHLQIVTPDRKVFDGEAEKIIVRTLGGDVCILARHIDYAAPLGIGEARVTDAEGNTRTAACSGGMLGVSGGEVRVMATTFEWADEIDLARAEKAQQSAQQQLEALERTDKDYAIVEAKLKRALARIHAKG